MGKKVRVLFLVLFFVAVCGVFAGKDIKAAGRYQVKVNKQQNVVTVYQQQENGKYKPVKAFVCSAGYATPLGTFSLGEKLRWHTLDGPSYGQYCTRITDGILFHSVWYYSMTKNSQSYVQYNKLGTTASHGCVRLTVADAKWIYDNVPSGSPVTIYNSAKAGPLGKPKAIKVVGYQGWDPTDPDPANPYKKKKPSISGAVSKTIPYGSKFNPKKGIQVKNSNGYNAKDLLTLVIKYKMDNAEPYKEVKKVDTKKPGKYKVTYVVVDEINHKAKATAVYKVSTSVSVSSIKLNKKKKTLYLGGAEEKSTFTLEVTKIKPASATQQKVKFSSSNPEVAEVSQKGVVTALKTGTADIIVKALDGSGMTAVCSVTVRQLVTKLTLKGPGGTLDVGNAMQLRVTVKPADVTDLKIKYSSSDTSIATVSETGSVRALKPGTVTITATAQDGSKKKGKFTITVYYVYEGTETVKPDGVTVATGSAWSAVAEKLPKEVTVQDKNGNKAAAAISWSCAEYDAIKPGTYNAVGKIALPEGWTGTAEDWTVPVVVAEDPKKDETAGGTK